MSDELLPHYQRELEYFRQVAPEFARRHPTMAGRLRMSEEEIDDPHVERLIQAVAFLNARTRRKIDDDFSEISQALLQVLYPHYLAPFPSAAIVRFALPPDQAELVQGFSIPRGSSLETEPIDGEPYRFRTCYPVTVWPIERDEGRRAAVVLPASRRQPGRRTFARGHQAGADRLRRGRLPISAFGFERLRFFINAPPQLAYRVLRDHLQQPAGSGRVGRRPGRRARMILDRDCLRLVGFERDEALVESPAEVVSRLRIADRVLRVSPEVPVLRSGRAGPEARPHRFGNSRTMNIDICLDRHVESLERYVTAADVPTGVLPDRQPVLAARRVDPPDAVPDGVSRRSGRAATARLRGPLDRSR